jgi:hypothetical protein
VHDPAPVHTEMGKIQLYLNLQKTVQVTKNHISEIQDPRFIFISINVKREDKKEGGCTFLGVKFTKKWR